MWVSCRQSVSNYIYENLFLEVESLLVVRRYLSIGVKCVKLESLTLWLVVASSRSLVIASVFETHAGCAKRPSSWSEGSGCRFDARYDYTTSTIAICILK